MKKFYINSELFKGTEDEFLAIEKFYCKTWKLNGKAHRDDGPAKIYSDGEQCWYQNGLIHRDGGPAMIYSNGAEYWCRNGNYHRIDGPAVIRSDGVKAWYIYGTEYFHFFDLFFPMMNYIKDKFPGE